MDRETPSAVVLGASEFPRYPEFSKSSSFLESAESVRDYFLNTLEVPDGSLLWLFDSPDSFSDQQSKIEGFLKELYATKGSSSEDLIVYYVGHGGFAESNQYFLAIRDTQDSNPFFTSLPMAALAKLLKEHARHVRRYLILDCCFAAAAYSAFQSSSPLQAADRQAQKALAKKGTALLCASGSRNPADSRPGQTFTMFTRALLHVLRNGVPSADERLSLSMVCETTRELIKDWYEDEGVRPEIHTPEQAWGDVAKVPLFPNPGASPDHLRDEIQRLKATIDSLKQQATNHDISVRAVSPGETEVGPVAYDPEPVAKRRLVLGLTSAEWNSVPRKIRTDIMDSRRELLLGALWIILSVVVALFAFNRSVYLLFDYAFLGYWTYYLSLILGGLALIPLAFRLLLPEGRSRRHRRRLHYDSYDFHGAADPAKGSEWLEYGAVQRAMNRDTVSVLPGVPVHTGLWTLGVVILGIIGLLGALIPLAAGS